MSRKTLTVITIAVVTALFGAACDGDDPGPIADSHTTSPPSLFTRPATTSPTIDFGCTASFPYRLGVRTAVQAEVPYLDDVQACTRRAQDATLVVNNSDVAWTISSSPGGANVAQLTEDIEAASFRDAAALVYRSAVLAPKSTVRIDAGPSRVEWNLAPGLSVMWLAHEHLTKKVRNYGEKQLTELLTVGLSPRRRALVTCSVGAYNIAGDAGTALNGPRPVDRLLAGLGIAARGTECAVAWKKADAEVLSRFRTTATWEDDVARLARDATFLETANSKLSILHRLGKALLLIRPRG